jgi:hypothetical protein
MVWGGHCARDGGAVCPSRMVSGDEATGNMLVAWPVLWSAISGSGLSIDSTGSTGANRGDAAEIGELGWHSWGFSAPVGSHAFDSSVLGQHECEIDDRNCKRVYTPYDDQVT